jgi:hypothetical protein
MNDDVYREKSAIPNHLMRGIRGIDRNHQQHGSAGWRREKLLAIASAVLVRLSGSPIDRPHGQAIRACTAGARSAVEAWFWQRRVWAPYEPNCWDETPLSASTYVNRPGRSQRALAAPPIRASMLTTHQPPVPSSQPCPAAGSSRVCTGRALCRTNPIDRIKAVGGYEVKSILPLRQRQDSCAFWPVSLGERRTSRKRNSGGAADRDRGSCVIGEPICRTKPTHRC